jgi:1-acyl-sn-glycerol-3-phosphate acyltransferase
MLSVASSVIFVTLVFCRSKARILIACRLRTTSTFDWFWLGRTLPIAQCNQQSSYVLAVASWTTPCLTRALRNDDAFVIERCAHFDRLITADQNATGC